MWIRRVVKTGGSLGVVVPKAIALAWRLERGSYVSMVMLKDGSVQMEVVEDVRRKRSRDGRQRKTA